MYVITVLYLIAILNAGSDQSVSTQAVVGLSIKEFAHSGICNNVVYIT